MTDRTHHYHGPKSRATEQGITAEDVPTGTSDPDPAWTAWFAALGDPWREDGAA